MSKQTKPSNRAGNSVEAMREQMGQLEALLMERESQIQDCSEQLQKMQALETEAAQHEEQVAALTEQWEATRSDLEDAQTKIAALKEQNQALQDAIDAHSGNEELEALRKEAEKAEAGLKAKLKSLADEQAKLAKKETAAQKKIKTYQTKIKTLQRQVREWKKKALGNPPVEIPSSAQRFQLFLYAEDGQMRGYIEHPLSSDHLPLQGMETEVIESFLNGHLPEGIEAEAPAIEPEAHPEEAAPTMTEEKPSAEPKDALTFDFSSLGRPQIGRLQVTQDGKGPGGLRSDTRFIAELDLDLKEMKVMHRPSLPVNVKVFARNLDTPNHLLIADEWKEMPWSDVLRPQVEAGGLPAGCYRLETTVTIRLDPDVPAPLSAYASEMVVVQ